MIGDRVCGRCWFFVRRKQLVTGTCRKSAPRMLGEVVSDPQAMQPPRNALEGVWPTVAEHTVACGKFREAKSE